MIIDADGNVQRDITAYASVLAERCWIVIDDYAGPSTKPKVAQTRAEVDTLTAAGSLEGSWTLRMGHVDRALAALYASCSPMTR